MNPQIAFLGLGLMGGSMAANLAQAGLAVKGWNRSSDRPSIKVAQDAGVEIVATLSNCVELADLIFTCVGDVPDVESVLLGPNGVINFAKPGALIADFSTIGPIAARQIGTALQNQDLHFIDAPVSGGDIGAKNGTLTIMVGGDRSDFDRCYPYLEKMGKKIIFCGPLGSGQAVKMCNQVLAALNMIGLCEAITLAQQQNIDPHLMIEVCSSGAAGSWALANLGPKIVNNDLAPGFAIKHIIKDLRLVQESLGESSQSLLGVELADRLFKIVSQLDAGKGEEQGTQAMIRAYSSFNFNEIQS